MKKTFYFLLLGLLLPVLGFSQNLKLAYNGSIVYPGAKVGFEKVYLTSIKDKHKKHGTVKKITRECLLTANLGYYHHIGFHDNLYLTLGWTKRRTLPKGFFMEFSPEAGISRTFLGGTIYKVDKDNKITVNSCSGYFYPLLSLGGGCGYDFSIRNPQKPLMAYFKLNALAMYPYNSTIYVRPAFELGFIYKLKPSNR